MKRRRASTFLLVLSLALVSLTEAYACRYNVRETGFVDLGIETCRLALFVASDTPAKQISEIEALATEILADSTVPFELISAELNPDHPALEYRRFTENQSSPSAALVSPGGRSWWLGPLWKGVFSRDQVRSTLLAVVSSPMRSRIAEELATAFAVVLLIEGADQPQNRRARTHVIQAIETLESELEYFPKPIKKGPVLITSTREEALSEQLLLWSLHLESDDLELPIAAILYGKGRWIGPIMIGEEITLDLVSRILFLVGADCECDLDPRLLRGTGLLIPWNRRLQALVTRDLGFDPDNPFVKTEVSQILRVNNWQAYTEKDQIKELQIPTPESGPGETASTLFSLRFLYLIGGLVTLVLCIGAYIFIRAEREKQRAH